MPRTTPTQSPNSPSWWTPQNAIIALLLASLGGTGYTATTAGSDTQRLERIEAAMAQLGQIEQGLQSVTTAVDMLRGDFSELKAEHRTFRESTATQYASLTARMDTVERRLTQVEQQGEESRQQYRRMIDQWVEDTRTWRKQVLGEQPQP